MLNQEVDIISIDRSSFNNMLETDKEGNVYFVTEGSQNNYNTVSLYLGNAKKCDIEEIEESIVLNYKDPSNKFHLQEQYMIKNKLYYYIQNLEIDSSGNTKTFYRVVLWDGEQFLDIGRPVNIYGQPTKVHIVTSLPTSGMLNNQVYINVQDKSIYVYHDSQYIELVSKDIYATKQQVDKMYDDILAILDAM